MATLDGQCLVDPVTGAAGRAFAKLRDDPDSGLAPAVFAQGTPGRQILAAILEAVTAGVLDELRANGVVTVVVSSGGLQTSTSPGATTTAPAVPATLTGTLA